MQDTTWKKTTMAITINREDIINKLEEDAEFNFKIAFPIEGDQLKEYAVGLAKTMLLAMETKNETNPWFIPAEDFLDVADMTAELVELNEDFVFTEGDVFPAAHSLQEARESTVAAIENSICDTIVGTVAAVIADLYDDDSTDEDCWYEFASTDHR